MEGLETSRVEEWAESQQGSGTADASTKVTTGSSQNWRSKQGYAEFKAGQGEEGAKCSWSCGEQSQTHENVLTDPTLACSWSLGNFHPNPPSGYDTLQGQHFCHSHSPHGETMAQPAQRSPTAGPISAKSEQITSSDSSSEQNTTDRLRPAWRLVQVSPRWEPTPRCQGRGREARENQSQD
ncbi:hypothetical protein EYF80_011880 [Liparis tanakae]|uniref:Uncharacterized protein n=1 Tax=Liparis tanakae TaxID=230148 RepID=A0A4Z2IKW1_9TELE|nr:hypothetical protein EYF80_011880 [Liparis tanakae]